MQDDDFAKIKKYFPKKDDALIRELMNECRDIDDVMVRLSNNDESANWKKNETKSKKTESDRNSRSGQRRPQRAPRENKPSTSPPKKAKEPAGALLQKKKQPEFGPASNATWGDLKYVDGDIVSTAKPAQPQSQPSQPIEKAVPVQQETATPTQQEQTQQPSTQQNPNNKRKQATNDINPENVQQPQQTQSENQNQQQQPSQIPTQNENNQQKAQRPKSASLFLPVSLNNITPDLSKFGIFAGPLPQETPTKRAPELVCVPVQPTFVVPPRPKVILSNQFHHFEIQRPPSPPPQPKIQPPVSVNIETQTLPPPQVTQKDESTAEIQQQQQQQIPISQVNALPHVAPVQPTSVGPVGSQPLFVNYAYPPFAPFPYAQFDPNAAQQAQQPVAFVQYPINQGAYPIPFATLPPGYQPMAAPIPQGAQQQPQPSQPQTQPQQPQPNQRQMPKNYNNNKSQYNEDQRSNYNYNNANNNRNQPYHGSLHQNRGNPQYQ